MLKLLRSVAGLSLLMACNDLGSVIDERRPAVQAQLDRVAALAPALAAVPPYTAARFEALPISLILVQDSVDFPLPTATILYPEDLTAMSGLAPEGHSARLTLSTILPECNALLKTGQYVSSSSPAHPIIAQKYLEKCKFLRYAFVLRTSKIEGREFRGDLVLFDLQTGKALGGMPLSVSSAGLTVKDTSSYQTRSTRTSVTGRRTTTVTTHTSDTYRDADAAQLTSDIAAAIKAGVKQHIAQAQIAE